MEYQQEIYSKEAIKNRMLQNLGRLWGVRNVSSLDPLVKLLVEAFSEEVLFTNNEIHQTGERLIERIAKTLTPINYTHPVPAHALAFYIPKEHDTELLMNYQEFLFRKTIKSYTQGVPDQLVDIAFTPLDNIVTTRANIKYVIAGGMWFQTNDDLSKTPLAKTELTPTNHNKVYIGIDTSVIEDLNCLSELNLLCLNENYEYLNYLYDLLPFVKAFCGDKLLSVTKGRSYVASGETHKGLEKIFNEESLQYGVRQKFKKQYEDKFIQIKGIDPLNTSSQGENKSMTLEIERIIENNPDLESKLKLDNILWITLEFPPNYNSEVLKAFKFSLNAFPIYNRKWRSVDYKLDIMGNIIPIETKNGEFLLHIDKVIDGEGNTYTESPMHSDKGLDKGLYTIRRGGIERFTQRDAINTLENTLNKIRDESIAFSIINRDKARAVLNEISDKIKSLNKEIKTSEKSVADQTSYVVFEPLDKDMHTHVSYWITHSELANEIRSGTKLNSQTQFQNITLLTSTKEGEKRDINASNIGTFQYALMTRDKIITEEDLKSFCRMFIGNNVTSINLGKGIKSSHRPKGGFIRTIKVNILVSNFEQFEEVYWKDLTSRLLKEVDYRTIDGPVYEFIISNNDNIEKIK